MNKKTKIAIFVDGDFIPSYDGASNRFHYLSRYLSLNGAEVVVFHGYREWSNISLIKKEPFRTYIFPIDHYYNNLELIASILIKEKVDIIQFDNLEPILLQGVKLAKLTGAKLVSEMHYVVRNLAKKLGADSERLLEIEKIEKEVGKNIDHLICLSDEDKPFLEKYLKLDSKRMSIIPSGVDCDEIKYFGPNLKSKNVVFLGNLYFKPNEDAVRIIKSHIYPELKKYGFKFTIGGDCPLDLKEELSEVDFIFTGTIPDLNDLFKNATFALAPIDEGTGMRIKLLNYLAAGIPVLTTSIATNGFNDKKCFFIDDNYSNYTSKIISLFEDKKKIKNIAKKGRILIEKQYNWNKIAKKTINTYEEIIKEETTEKIIIADGFLKSKEPVWLEEAVAKKRFKKIISSELPKSFSFCVLDNGKFKTFKIEKIIALEGMPGAGKTTFINNYIKKENIIFLPQLEIKNRKILKEDNLITSKEFFRIEKEKTEIINDISKGNKEIVVDRTFLTTLAYCYARSRVSGEHNEYEKLIKYFYKIKNTITFPTDLVYLDVSIEESIKRRSIYTEDQQYKNWFSKEFLWFFKEFYDKEISKFISINFHYINTTNLNIDEVEKEIIKVLCKI